MLRNQPNRPTLPKGRLPRRIPAKYNTAAATDGYRRYRFYSWLLLIWLIVVAAYIFVLEYASRHYGFLGIRGSAERARNFEILTFIRTGLVIIHVPVITAVLASSIPYFTTKKTRRDEYPPLRFEPIEFPWSEKTKLPQLFHLADRSWAGLVGWIDLLLHGRDVHAFSLTWLHLTLITACSYLGFPILSLAYGVTSSQYWISAQLPTTVSVGGLAEPYSVAYAMMQENYLWMSGGVFDAAADLGELTLYNSSDPTKLQYDGIQPLSFWANNNTLTTLPLRADGNAQLATIGVQAFATCGFNNYNATVHLPSWSRGPIPDLAFVYEDVDPLTNNGLPYVLKCKNDCAGTNSHNPYSCSAQSSLLQITPSWTSGDDQQAFEGQVLSCVEQHYSALHTEASIQLARQGPGAWTQVANCKVSLTYTQPTVNPLIGVFMAYTSTAKTLPILDVDPVQLLNLTLSSFISFFHNGPSASSYLPPITDGFNWVTQLPLDDTDTILGLIENQGFNAWKWYDDPGIYEGIYGTDMTAPYGTSSNWSVTTFSENVFLAPLAYYLSDPAFFETGPGAAVVFETDLQVAHGRIPPEVALAILFLPMLWALGMSLVASSQRRWTSTLDSFAIFRLGGDWAESMKDRRLASMSTAKEELLSIPGTVLVDPERAMVKLAYSTDSKHGSESQQTQERAKQPSISELMID